MDQTKSYSVLTQRLRKSERHERILQLLVTNPTIRATQLASELSVSTETMRRDLSELDDAGRINRTYGGAVRSLRFEPQLSERLANFVEERQRIAQAALSEIGDLDTILIGGGASAQHFARALTAIKRPLTVITMSHTIAPELAVNSNITVMLLPGMYEPSEGILTGPETTNALQWLQVPLAILGASGIDSDGVSEAMLSAAHVYSAVSQHSNRQLVLADHSKFSRRALSLVARWKPGMRLYTDQTPPASIASAIEQAGATYRIV